MTFATSALLAAGLSQATLAQDVSPAPFVQWFDGTYQTQFDRTFTWDFGDPGSGVWERGASGQSRNHDTPSPLFGPIGFLQAGVLDHGPHGPARFSS